MKFIFICKIYIIKLIIFILEKCFNRGSAFPGTIALKLDKNILKKLANNYKIILITGTNGKTTTTSMIYNTLKNANFDTITNSSGANMINGIVTCFIKNYKLNKENKEKFAVLEIDESYVYIIKNYLNIDFLVITNLFRDQTDRNIDYHFVFDKIMSAVKNNKDTKLILNGDASVLCGLGIENETIYYGFSDEISLLQSVNDNEDFMYCKFCNTKYSYKSLIHSYLGSFYCSNCGFKRNKLKYICKGFNKIDDMMSVNFNDEQLTINSTGIYNIYNALCCYSLCKELKISTEIINKTLSYKDIIPSGRQQVIYINKNKVIMNLVKNPSAFNLIIDDICKNNGSFNAFIFLNDNFFDGIDVSWIYDVNFEKLNKEKIQNIYVLGKRKYDMAVRLNIIFNNIKIIENIDDIIDFIQYSEVKNNYFFTNYTSMLELRRYLMSKGHIKSIY